MTLRILGALVALAAAYSPAMAQDYDNPSDTRIDARHRPPMDNPPLPWVKYNRDAWGRSTYLTPQCIASYGQKLDVCLMVEEQEHQDEIRRHYRESGADQPTAERDAKRREYDARLAHNAEMARQAAAENARADLLPETHAATIRDFKGRIVRFRSMIARERRIGATSGYVNKDTLYRLGEAIEMANERIAQEYRRYRELGGRKPLAAL